MKIFDDEQLLAYCLGDCSPAMHDEITRLAANDPDFRERLSAVRQITMAVRTAPTSRVKKTLARTPVRIALLSAMTALCVLAGMLLQARTGLMEPRFAPASDETFHPAKVSHPLSWEKPHDHVL